MTEELTTLEAEREYQVSRGHLTHLAQQGVIQARRVGPVWVLQRGSLEHWIANRPKRGGYRGRKAHRQQETGASQPTQDAGTLPARPPAPQETVIDAEGAHIRIEPLQPDGQRWLEAKATQDDMQATIYLRPYGAYASAFVLDKSYDRASSAPGKMGRRQEQRGKDLLALLEKHMRAALVTAGWHTEERAGNELWRYREP